MDNEAAAPRDDAAPAAPVDDDAGSLPGTLEQVPPMGLAAAARLTGIARSTLQRRADELLSHGAHRRDDGQWSIPLTTLQALGMLDRVDAGREAGSESDDAAPAAPVDDEAAQLREQLAAAEHRAREAEHRAELAETRSAAADALRAAAEQLAAERAVRLEERDRTVRLLEPLAAAVVDRETAAAEEPAARSTWLPWRRK